MWRFGLVGLGVRVAVASLVAVLVACSGDDGDSSEDGGDGNGDTPGDDDGGASSDDDSSPDASGGGSSSIANPTGELRAFPSAEGFAAMVTGGRGGRVIKVTTLDASGPGSLQAALDEAGPRIIVFEVSGVIVADIIEVTHGDVTIAGQTAPGGGITIQGRLFGAYSDAVTNVIVRHVRVRPVYDGSDGQQFDAIQFSRNSRVMLDHISVSAGVDETIDLYSAWDVTVQWSTIESSGTEGHPEGAHNYGLINGPDGCHLSVHHNLFAHHANRTPAIANGPAEVRNNVMYNVRHGFVHHNPASGPFNLVGNYFRVGQSDELIPFYFDDENDSPADDLGYYVADNWVDGEDSTCSSGTLDNPWEQCENDLLRDESFRSASEFDFDGVTEDYRVVMTESPQEAYDAVLAEAGAFPRDVVALRSVSETEDRTGEWGARDPGDLMEGLEPTEPPLDADDDGMADEWESSHGLDPQDGTDHSEVMGSGYTAIEEYINELADALL